MRPIIKGRVFKVGDDINTDYIIPAKYLDLYEPEELGPHAFEGLGQDYSVKVKGYTIVAAGENFGLGSAREQAPNALKGAGIKVILAKSFARIFYRNTLNVGIVPIEAHAAVAVLQGGETITIDLEQGTIESDEKVFRFPIFPSLVMEIIMAGGMIPYLKRKFDLKRPEA